MSADFIMVCCLPYRLVSPPTETELYYRLVSPPTETERIFVFNPAASPASSYNVHGIV